MHQAKPLHKQITAVNFDVNGKTEQGKRGLKIQLDEMISGVSSQGACDTLCGSYFHQNALTMIHKCQ
jgi:hypothetical protein